MISMNLTNGWELAEMPLTCQGQAGVEELRRRDSGWLSARVPGEVHLDLIRAGRMEEPLFSDNCLSSRWPEARSWWYRHVFHVDDALLAMERIQLIFEGIDLAAEVYLNDRQVGTGCNAFVPLECDVTGCLRLGRNELLVRVTSGLELVPEPERDKWRLSAAADPLRGPRQLSGMRHLRKPQYSTGWDWVDTLPNIGIWRRVRLEGRRFATLTELRLDTVRDGEGVALEMDATIENLHPFAERACRLSLTITRPDGQVLEYSYPLAAPTGLNRITDRIAIAEPQLWWPAGYGDQPLYGVVARILDAADCETDRREFHVGLRFVEIDRRPDATGSRFCIQINGVEVFCRGANWIPADAILARIDAARYQTLVDMAVEANMNMLRVWGGGIYEDEAFYMACDRAGILVWQDFMYACMIYPDDDATFRDSVRREAAAAVRQLRHHPSIVLWCGNNEVTWGTHCWWNQNPPGDPAFNAIGSRIYRQILPGVCQSLDPHRPYWPGSPAGGPEPNSELHGDCHWWHQATMHPDVTRRIDQEVYDECRSRFVSEYGVIGPLYLESYKQCLKPDEIAPDNPVFQRHVNEFDKATTPAAIERHYADLTDLPLDSWILYGQLFQSAMYAGSIRALRFRKHDSAHDCQGVLIWMYADCWGETGWTIVDYFLRRKPSFYGFRRASLPQIPIIRRRGDTLVTRIVNDSREDLHCTLHRGWLRFDGTRRELDRQEVTVPANSMHDAGSCPLDEHTHPAADWLFGVWMTNEEGAIIGAPDAWIGLPQRKLHLSTPVFHVHTSGDEVQITSDVYCHAVHCPDAGLGWWTDNYFDLLPGVPHIVRVRHKDAIPSFRAAYGPGAG